MCISDWSSDLCSSDLTHSGLPERSARCLIDVDLVGQVVSNQGKAPTIIRRTDRNIGIQCDVVFLNIVIQGRCIGKIGTAVVSQTEHTEVEAIRDRDPPVEKIGRASSRERGGKNM